VVIVTIAGQYSGSACVTSNLSDRTASRDIES
jgi:hypothetical protein